MQLILPATTPRHYGNIRVENYLELVAASMCKRPVLTNKVKPELEERYTLEPVAELADWYRLVDAESACLNDTPEQ